jgi:SAM-dependent methyltransferase
MQFSKKYSRIYDILYADKDYHGEVRLIEQVITKYNPDVRKILDYGCGTGMHAKALALKGYQIFGIDKNANMLAIAEQKLKDHKNVHFYNARERAAIDSCSIDLCITLFDVMSYMNRNEEIRDFLTYVKDILTDKGLLIFDFWYGPGVLNVGPEKRWKVYQAGDKKILRLTDPVHNHDNCIVSSTHEILISDRDKIINRFVETHNMRYFFKNEILMILDLLSFEALNFGTWKDLYAPPTVTDWSALVVAQKV